MGECKSTCFGDQRAWPVDTPGGRVEMTAAGRAFLAADVEGRKRRLNAILRQIYVFDLVIRGLEASPTQELEEDHLLGQLALTFPQERPQRILHTLVSWARYAELFRYSAPRRVLHGLNPHPPLPSGDATGGKDGMAFDASTTQNGRP